MTKGQTPRSDQSTDACMEALALDAARSIKDRCSYIAVNRRALGVDDDFEPMETSVVFTMPQLQEISMPPYVQEVIVAIDKRIEELEKEEEPASPPYIGQPLQEAAAPAADTEGREADDLGKTVEENDVSTMATKKFVEVVTKNAREHEAKRFASSGHVDVLVVAPAGSGKSMLINRAALWLLERSPLQTAGRKCPCEQDRLFERWLDANPWVKKCIDGKLPLLLRCRDVSPSGAGPCDLPRAVASAMFKCPDRELPEKMDALAKADPSKIVFLLDGLDELPLGTSAEDVYGALLSMTRPQGEGRFSTIATTRESVFDTRDRLFFREHRFEVFKIVPLNELSKERRGRFVFSFAQSWYAGQGLSQKEALLKARDLRDAIDEDWDLRFQSFLRTPLELVLLLALFGDVESIPATEYGLYSRYARTRLSWRHGSARSDDLLLLLSFCASKAASLAAGLERFSSSVPEGDFLRWLEIAYWSLGPRIDGIQERGFETRSDAAMHDLDELVEVHGLLSRKDGRVCFEHSQLQVFFAENGLVSGACPRAFWRQSYAEIYAAKKREGLGDDWAKLFSFFVQDDRVGDRALRSVWRAVCDEADPRGCSDGESEVFSSILLDGRIAVQKKSLEPLLEAFCDEYMTSNQIPTYRRISTDGRYSPVVEAIDEIYERGGEYRCCFAAASVDIFSIAKNSSRFGKPEINAIAALERKVRGNAPTTTRLLHRLEILYFFSEIHDEQLAFFGRLFDGRSDRCNEAVRDVVRKSLERFCAGGMQSEMYEIVWAFGALAENKAVRRFVRESAASDVATAKRFIESIGRFLDGAECDAATCSGAEKAALSFLAASIPADAVLAVGFDNPAVKMIKPYVKKHYLKSMRWMSEVIFGESEETAWGETLGAFDVFRDAFDGLLSRDEGLSVLLEQLMREWGRLPAENAARPEEERHPMPVLLDMEACLHTIVNACLHRQDGRVPDINVHELRFSAAAALNAWTFNVIEEPHALMIVDELLREIAKCVPEADRGFPWPWETLESLKRTCSDVYCHYIWDADAAKSLVDLHFKPPLT